MAQKSREKGDVGPENREKGDLPPCSPSSLKVCSVDRVFSRTAKFLSCLLMQIFLMVWEHQCVCVKK